MMNILRVIDLSLIWLNSYCGLYSIPKESKYTAVFLSINNETRLILLFRLSLTFMAGPPSFFLGKSPLEKTQLNLGLIKVH